MNHSVWNDLYSPTGGPRFYPPGQHPAIARWQAQRRAAEALPDSPQRDEFLAYIKDKIAQFEQVEAEERTRRQLQYDAYPPS